MPCENTDRQSWYNLAGWLLFVVCAFIFLYAAFRDRDPVLGLASLVFLAGCIAFLIPLIFHGRAGHVREERDSEKAVQEGK